MTRLYHIDDVFRHRITTMRGEAGRAWIDHIPATIAEFAERWSLTVHEPFPNLSFNVVLPVTRADGSPAVLKLGFPTDREFQHEIAALTAFNDHGMVRLLASDPARAVMLLERVTPGTPLTTLDDDAAATAIAANLLRDFWPSPPPGHTFPSVSDWGRGFARMRERFAGGSGPIPPRLADQAERLFADLAQTQAPPVLLHGDLHHDNILDSGAGRWVAIDPKGVIGEPAYELGAFLRNPVARLGTANFRAMTACRIAIFADTLDLDPERIRDWALAQAILSAWWSIEDNDTPTWIPAMVGLAELLATLLASEIRPG